MVQINNIHVHENPIVQKKMQEVDDLRKQKNWKCNAETGLTDKEQWDLIKRVAKVAWRVSFIDEAECTFTI
jgi:hypothetical protein